MNTTLFKFLRDAGMAATGMYLTAQLKAEKKEIRTNIKRLSNRTFAFQQLSYLRSTYIARSRDIDKWLRIHTTPMEELWIN